MKTRPTLVAAVLFAAICAVAPVVVHAQGATLGAKLGLSMSKFSIENAEEDLENVNSIMGGGFLRFGMGRISIQPELMVVTRGFGVSDTDGEADLKLDYIEVSPLLHLSLGVGSIAPYIIAGPAFAFEISCNVDFEFDGGDASTDCDDADVEDVVVRKKNDIGVIGGAGLSLPLGPGNVLFEGRYTFGLTSINDDDDDNDSVKNRTIGLLVGYEIRLGR
jgi:hypothetical protein